MKYYLSKMSDKSSHIWK